MLLSISADVKNVSCVCEICLRLIKTVFVSFCPFFVVLSVESKYLLLTSSFNVCTLCLCGVLNE